MKRLLFWKCSLSLILCSLGLLSLGSCGPAPQFPSPVPSLTPPPSVPQPTLTPPANVPLTVWHSWDAGEEEVIRNLLAEYQSEHPGVTVRLRRVPVGGILSEYEEAVLAGEGPDLLAGRSHWIGRLAEGQVISPLEDILGEETWGTVYPFALDGVRYEGHLYAVPYACETVALYYNRDFVNEPPTTTTALLELAATWPGQDQPEQVEQAGLAFPMSFYNTVGYLYAFGGRLFDDQDQVAINSPETWAWLTWLQEVRASPGIIATDSYGQADALFKAGSVAMVINGSWALPDYVRALGMERLGVSRLPMLDQTQAWPTPLVGYRVLMVNPVLLPIHPEETLDLLRFLGAGETQSLLAGPEGFVPTSSVIDLSTNVLLAGFVQQAEAGRPRPVSLRIEAVWDPVQSLLYNVTSRNMPIDLALQETQQQIEQTLAEMEALPLNPQ